LGDAGIECSFLNALNVSNPLVGLYVTVFVYEGLADNQMLGPISEVGIAPTYLVVLVTMFKLWFTVARFGMLERTASDCLRHCGEGELCLDYRPACNGVRGCYRRRWKLYQRDV